RRRRRRARARARSGRAQPRPPPALPDRARRRGRGRDRAHGADRTRRHPRPCRRVRRIDPPTGGGGRAAASEENAVSEACCAPAAESTTAAGATAESHSGPLVEVFYFDGCPNHGPALAVVERVARELGLSPEIRLVHVPDQEAARRLRFLGSPTIRVA